MAGLFHTQKHIPNLIVKLMTWWNVIKPAEHIHLRNNIPSDVYPMNIRMSLCIRTVWSVFSFSMKKLCILGYPKCTQGRFWSACMNVQADLNLHWAHMFDVRRYIFCHCVFYTLRFYCLFILYIATDRALFSSEKCWYLSYYSTKRYVVGSH